MTYYRLDKIEMLIFIKPWLKDIFFFAIWPLIRGREKRMHGWTNEERCTKRNVQQKMFYQRAKWLLCQSWRWFTMFHVSSNNNGLCTISTASKSGSLALSLSLSLSCMGRITKFDNMKSSQLCKSNSFFCQKQIVPNLKFITLPSIVDAICFKALLFEIRSKFLRPLTNLVPHFQTQYYFEQALIESKID